MRNKAYTQMSPIIDTNSFQNDFHTGYETQFQPDIVQSDKSGPGPLRYVQLKWWCWELVAASVSLALFISVIVVLRIFDGRALPELSGDITLNTTVSLLATISKTALLLVTAATMSQFKWLWLHKSSRKLRDLQVFDEASRGPWGAITLLQHSRVSVASLGALVIILLLGFDPFIQQLITTPHRDVSNQASSPVHRAATFNQSIALAVYDDVNSPLARLAHANPPNKIFMSVTNGANNQGNCQHSPLVSNSKLHLAFVQIDWPVQYLCRCYRLRPKKLEMRGCSPEEVVGLTGVNRTCTYNLPNSNFSYVYLVFQDKNYTEVGAEMRMNYWTTLMERTTFSDNTLILLSYMTFVDSGNLIPGIGREQVMEATECSIAMCVQEHVLSVESGITKHSIKSAEQPFDMKIDPTIETPIPFYSYDTTPVDIDGVTYSVDGVSTTPYLLEYINDTFSGDVTADYTNTTTASGNKYDGGLTPSSALSTSFYAGLNFNQSVANMATSVSQYMRSLSDETTAGTAHNSEVYVRVKWEWIAFPSLLIFGGIALLVIAIIQTNLNGLEVWKSSSLPLWFHGPPNGSGRVNSFGAPLERVNTLMEMEAEASQIRVTLEKGEDGRGCLDIEADL